MKAITIKQPFATLIASGLKRYEFRSWKTSYRGEILIHAAKSVDRKAMKRFEHLGLTYPQGCVIARGVLTDCVRVDEAMRAKLRQENFNVYAGVTEDPDWEGYGFRLDEVQAIDPVPAKGMLGLWPWEEVLD